MRARLKLSLSGTGGEILVGVGFDHGWTVPAPIEWLPATGGTWSRKSNSFISGEPYPTYISLLDQGGRELATIRDEPWEIGQRFYGHVLLHFWSIESFLNRFDVTVVSAPGRKTFRIRERSELQAVAPVLGLVDLGASRGFFEILDVTSNRSVIYGFYAVVLSVGLPWSKVKLLKAFVHVPGSLSDAGPWNDFSAPEWMTVDDFAGKAILLSAGLGFGSDKSVNGFSFAGEVDGREGYLCKLDLSTGSTYGLPSASESVGYMIKVANIR